MPFKSSKAFEVGKFLQSQLSRKTVLGQSVGGAGGSAGPGIAAISATGGSVSTVVASNGKTYKIHTFTTPGPSPFVVSSADPNAVAYLYIAGGGGGGGGAELGWTNASQGGGAGNFSHFSLDITAATYDVNIGTGGAAGIGGPPGYNGSAGNSSSFTSPAINLTVGGGAGGLSRSINNATGGAGGSLTTFTSGGLVALLQSLALYGRGNVGETYGPGSNLWEPVSNSPNHILYPRSPVVNRGNGGNGGRPAGSAGQAGYAQIYYEIEPT